jgi:hypothetical protein
MPSVQGDENPISNGMVRRSRKQIHAASVAQEAEMLRRWRQALPLAGTTWTRLSPDELRISRGNVHKLAGLIQLRYQTTREESDRQVAAFIAANVTANVAVP